MSITAIIFSGGKGDAATPARDLNIGGLNPARRIAHALQAAGCSRAVVAADALQAMAPAAVAKGLDVTIAPTGLPLEVPEGTAFLLVPADVLIDERIFAAMLAETAPCVVAIAPKDPTSIVAKVTAAWLQQQAPFRLDHDVFQRLTTAARVDAKTLDIQALDAYLPGHRRIVPMLWQPVTTRAEAKIAFDIILDSAQKGIQDWPAWFIHRPIARWIAARLAPTAVVPDQITVAAVVVGLISAVLFSQGLFLPGLILALCMGVLDGIDGQLARVKLTASSFGDLKHIVDKCTEYLIYLGIAYYFAHNGYGAAPYVMAGALILFNVADNVQLKFFQRLSGKSLCDFSSFDRTLRWVEGRRNTQLWAFLPFVLLGGWFAGFCMICAYGVLTFFIHQWRFVVAGRQVFKPGA